jgi:hypothetical protein
MSDTPELSYEEAVLLYTQTKIEMAKCFREGINIHDFFEFEKRLDMIDAMLKEKEEKLKESARSFLTTN